MAIREVGPGKTYADIAAAATAASSGDTIRCFFNTTDSTFVLSSLGVLTIEAAPGYTPSWLRAGTLITFEGTSLTISGLTIGRSDNGSGGFLVIAAYTTTARTITVQNCALSFGSGTPSIFSCDAYGVGTTVFNCNLTNVTHTQATNKLSTIADISGADVTRLGRMALTITGCSLRTNGIRSVSANGLFNAQTISKSILKIYTASGFSIDYAAGSTSTTTQSILDGMGVTTGPLLTCDCSKTTLSVKNCYLIRSNSSAVALTNHTPGMYPIKNTAISGNTTAGVACASTATEYCLFGGNGANYSGGGTVNANDKLGSPTYTDIVNADYSPTPVSQTINAGVDEGFLTDILGNTIPQGTGYDIGPYEFGTPPDDTLGLIDRNLYHASDITGAAPMPDTFFEIVPQDSTGALTDIKHLLMVWSLMDKRVETVELPADMKDVEWPDNRGWMAEPSAGNRMWLFDRRPMSNQVDEEMRLMLTEDLQWLIRDGIAADVTVTVTHTSRRRNVEIAVKRLDGTLERYGIDDLWNDRVV